MTRRQISFGFLSALGLLGAVWLAGLVLFVAGIARYTEPAAIEPLPAADAIVVLTGGSERLEAGLALLRAGKGQKLLISGVYPGVGLAKVLAHSDVPEELRECCIVLGHVADNTVGNALETQSFMESNGYRSLYLVTAHYHMPRSLLLLRGQMPDKQILPHPVSPDRVSLSDWWARYGTASLLVGEYNKYLFALVREVSGVL